MKNDKIPRNRGKLMKLLSLFLAFLSFSLAAAGAEAGLLAEVERDWIVPHRNSHVFAAQMIDDVHLDFQSSIPQRFSQPGLYEFAAVDHAGMGSELLNNPTWTIGFTLDTTTYEVPVPPVFNLDPSIDKYVLTVETLTPGATTDSISTRWSIYGGSTHVPEPSAIVLLGVALAGMMSVGRHHRRCNAPRVLQNGPIETSDSA
jgi:hypothetical protein